MSYPLCRDLDDLRQFFEGVFCRHPSATSPIRRRPSRSSG
jgi:hypothetical protein